MRNATWLLAIVPMMAGIAWAQSEAAQPKPSESVASSQPVAIAPKPDAEGVYFVGPQVTAPRLVRTMAAGYPSNAPVGKHSGKHADKVTGFTVLSMVIGADGSPTGIEVLHTHGDAYDAAAIAAVKQSKFAPGLLAGKPVPVRIDVRVPFHVSLAQAVPVVVIAERDLAPPIEAAAKQKRPPSYTPPIPIHMVDADFVDPGVKSVYEAVAIVTVTVSTEGVPTEVLLKRGLGFGADEKAIAAVKQYRFLPATSKGKPVAASREIEVKFAMF
jgi:TonB family protein